MAEKANHHYIPQFYLRNFSDGADKRKAKVFVYDKSTNKSFGTLVRNVGSRRYFNRIDIEGHDPNLVEDAFAEAEGEIRWLMDDVIRERAFPSGKHFNAVMNVIAWISLRNPRMRANMEDFHRQIAEITMEMTLSSRERFDALGRKAKAAGADLGDISYEAVKEYFDSKEFDIEVDRTHMIGLEMRTMDTILKPLSRRNWTFVTALPGEQFITSDEPTVLVWAREELYKPWISPGHALRETLLIFPLSSEVALIGAFEKDLDLPVLTWDGTTWVNTMVMWFCDSQIYARDGSFRVHAGEHLNLKGEDLPRILVPKKSAKT